MEVVWPRFVTKRRATPTLRYKRKVSLCQLLADLLTNGFTIGQAVAFMKQTGFYPDWAMTIFVANLTRGQPIEASFQATGFSAEQVVQIELANVHGNLAGTLNLLAQQMTLIKKQRENLLKMASYPVLLLCFVLALLLGMRSLLMPQLISAGVIKKASVTYVIIQQLPLFLLGVLGILLAATVIFKRYFARKSKIQRTTCLCRVPLVGYLVKQYYAAYFSLEWGKLFDQGLELSQIIYCMEQTKGTSLMKELAKEMQVAFEQGVPLTTKIKTYAFFTAEFSVIIEQGTIKGKLGQELLIYSQLLSEQLFLKVEKIMSLIQPLVFLFIAGLVVAIYAAMLLPMYQGI